jgi:hypothetical protein
MLCRSRRLSVIDNRLPQKVLIVCLCFSVLFTMTRAAARWYKIRRIPLAPEDWTSYLALASYITMCALYLATMTTYYNIVAVEEGTLAAYPSLADDLTVMLKEFLAVQFFFWLTLWAVKWSLLCMFKILTTGLIIQVRIWWGVMIFTWIAFAACCVTQFTSCSSFHAWFTAGREHLFSSIGLEYTARSVTLSDYLADIEQVCVTPRRMQRASG